jgi:hypothetical protein
MAADQGGADLMGFGGFGGFGSPFVNFCVPVTCVILNRFFHSLVLESEQSAELLRAIEKHGTRAVVDTEARLNYGAAKPWLVLPAYE